MWKDARDRVGHFPAQWVSLAAAMGQRIRAAVPTTETVGASGHPRGMGILRVDCNECIVRGLECSDCVISVLLGVPDVGATAGVAEQHAPRTASVELAADEQQALAALADSGLVPPLRLVRGVAPGRPTPHQPWLDERFAE